MSCTGWQHSTAKFLYSLNAKKANREATFALMDERFYGDPKKRIKGARNQLVDRDSCFAFLYNVGEGESGPERTLKLFCCGSDTLSMFVAGVHFTTKMIGTKSNKKLSGRTLWTTGQTIHCSIKKAAWVRTMWLGGWVVLPPHLWGIHNQIKK
jgi:hypothetical protein